MRNSFFVLFMALLFLTACGGVQKQEGVLQNPLLPGYYADPSVVQYDGKFYMYVTADPWGGDFLACWESDDFQNWTFNRLNWPTKEACTSSLSNENMVWAPSVVQRGDKFYMYVSVGSEVWAGHADHPLGPWENILVDRPMLPYDTTRFIHVIDAEAFLDDDGRAYLYWGSGWDWANGRCFAAELDDDMVSFKSPVVEITPSNYFEGPHVIKQNSKYYLTYSEGKTIDDTYEVRYAVGDSPLGPFVEAENSPILNTDPELEVYGPGHHTLMEYNNKHYILYHKHRLPFRAGDAYRQVCMNELHFDTRAEQIKTINPLGHVLFPIIRKEQDASRVIPSKYSSSSEYDEWSRPSELSKKGYSSLWRASDADERVWVMAEFDHEEIVEKMSILFEYAWEKYYFRIESSFDSEKWTTLYDVTDTGISGSPIEVEINQKARFIRIMFNTEKQEEILPAIWELQFYS